MNLINFLKYFVNDEIQCLISVKWLFFALLSSVGTIHLDYLSLVGDACTTSIAGPGKELQA